MSLPDHLALYRLVRLRRMIAASLGIPLLSLLVYGAAFGGQGRLWQSGVLWGVLALWVGMALWHATRYPRALANLLSGALATACLFLIAPIGDRLLSYAPADLDPRQILGLGILGVVAWIAALILSETGLIILMRRGAKVDLRRTTHQYWPQPPQAVYLQVRPRPETETALTLCGARAADGRFPVWSKTCLHGPTKAEARQPEPESQGLGPWGKRPNASSPHPPHFWVIDVQDIGPHAFSAIFATDDGRTEAIVFTIRPEGDGACVTKLSQSDMMNRIEQVFDYLGDLAGDVAQAEKDLVDGRAVPRANCLYPVDYPGKSWIEAIGRDPAPSLR